MGTVVFASPRTRSRRVRGLVKTVPIYIWRKCIMVRDKNVGKEISTVTQTSESRKTCNLILSLFSFLLQDDLYLCSTKQPVATRKPLDGGYQDLDYRLETISDLSFMIKKCPKSCLYNSLMPKFCKEPSKIGPNFSKLHVAKIIVNKKCHY